MRATKQWEKAFLEESGWQEEYNLWSVADLSHSELSIQGKMQVGLDSCGETWAYEHGGRAKSAVWGGEGTPASVQSSMLFPKDFLG